MNLLGIVNGRSRLKTRKSKKQAEEDTRIFKLAAEGDVTAMREFLRGWEENHEPKKRKTQKTAKAKAQEEKIPVKRLNPIANLTRRVKKSTPLMVCAELGHVEMIRNVLLPMCISNINDHDINGFSALTYAARNGRTEIVRVLLNYGADPSLEPPSQFNAWYWAVRKGYTEICMLLRDRVDVNARCFENSSSAIIEAAKHGHVEIFMALLEDPRIKINMRDSQGKTALTYIELYNRISLKSKIKPINQENDGFNPFADARITYLGEFIKEGNLRQVQTILYEKPGENVPTNVEEVEQLYQSTPKRNTSSNLDSVLFKALQDAASLNDVEIFKELLQRLELTESQLKSLINLGVSYGFVHIINVLMNVDTVKEQLIEWILDLAVKQGRFEVVDRLLKTTGSAVTKFHFEKCLSSACKLGQYRVAEVILDFHPPNSGYWSGGFIQQCFVTTVRKDPSGNSNTMKSLIKKGFSIRGTFISIKQDSSSDQHVTLWEHACEHDNLHILQALLECHEHYNIHERISPTAGTPLALCVQRRNVRAVRLFLCPTKSWHEDVDVNVKGPEGRSILHEAILNDRNGRNYEIIQIILTDPRVDVNTFRNDADSLSPIQDCKNDEIAFLLLEDGRVDLRMQNNYGITPLIHMCYEGRYKQVEKLLEIDHNPAVINGADGEGHTPLMKTVFQDRSYVYRTDKIEKWVKCAEVLLRYDTLNFLKQDITGKTAFIHAADTAKHKAKIPPEGDVLDLLLRFSKEQNIDVGLTSVDHTGNNALMFACFQNNIRTVRTLLKNYKIEDVAHLNQNGVSCFDEAVDTGQVQLVRLLLEFDKFNPGAINVNGRSQMGRTPLNRACAGRYQQFEIVQMILNHPDFNSINVKREPDMKTALMLISSSNSQSAEAAKIVKVLLAHPDIDVNAQDVIGETALMMCSGRMLNVGILSALLKHPSLDINMKTNEGHTALMIAAIDNSEVGIKQLLQHKNIDVNARDNNGMNVLHHCAKEGHRVLASMLVSCGKDLEIRALDNSGRTPEEIAREIARTTNRPTEHESIATFLMKQGSVSGKRIPSFYLKDTDESSKNKSSKKKRSNSRESEDEEEKEEEQEPL